MTEVISTTEVYCHACQSSHPARHIRDKGKILGMVDCPVSPWQTTLSDHAELFLQFRRQAGFTPEFRPPAERPYYFHYLSVTEECNCQCPVCFTASTPGTSQNHLTPAAAEQIATTALKNGVHTVVFIGGEPTIHPQLYELIEIFRRAKLHVWIATNGLQIAQTPEMAARLKSAGVAKVCLQFDTFDQETHLAIRGHRQIAAKVNAARAISEAGLILGLVCTVTSHNLKELSSFCRTVLAGPHPPQTIAIQAAAQSGRLATDSDKQITREEIVTSLIDGAAIAGLSSSHFWPIPICRPLNIFVHPDCAANTVAVITASGTDPLGHFVDMEKLLTRVAQMPARISRWTKFRLLTYALLTSVRRAGLILLVKHCFARLRGAQGVRFCFIGTGAFLRRDFHDLGRIERCASGVLTSSHCDSMCSYYSRQPFTQT